MRPIRWTLIPLLGLLALLGPLFLLGCDDNEDENDITPIRAGVDIPDPVPGGDPLLYFQVSSLDTSASDDIVVIDVLLQTNTAVEFDAVNLRVRFVPGIVQFAGFVQTAQADGQTYDPFGFCNSSATFCDKYPAPAPGPPPLPAPTTGPLCLPTAIGQANQTGNLILSMAAVGSSSCDSYMQAGTIKLLSLTFIAASTGSSPIDLLSIDPHDCEILSGLADLGLECKDRGATITATR